MATMSAKQPPMTFADPFDPCRDRARTARTEALEDAAKLAEDFEWALPLTDDVKVNEATDDAACEVCRQVAAAIRAWK